MLKCIGKFLDKAPKDFNSTAVTPAASHIFEVNEKGKKLDKNKR